MEYIRQFLILLRKLNNREDLKPPFRVILAIVMLVSVLIGTLLDVILPFNYILNGIRSFVAVFSGVSLFSIGYLLANYLSRRLKIKNSYYLPLRKRFSYKQRVNVSIVLGFIVVLLVIVGSNPSNFYTLKAALSITAGLTLITFTRKNRDEFLKGAYDIPDLRDVAFDNKEDERKTK